MGKFFIILGILAFIFIALWIAWIVYSRITAGKILKYGRNKKSFAFNYLSMRFSRLNVLRDVNLLITEKNIPDGGKIVHFGLIFVNRGGIFIIESVPGSGFVDIKEGGEWRRTINDKQYTFEDPFIANNQRVTAMKIFLRNEHFDNIPVHSIVLFTGKRVKFSKRVTGLITADELAPFMVDLNKDRFLFRSEIRSVVKIIKSKLA